MTAAPPCSGVARDFEPLEVPPGGMLRAGGKPDGDGVDIRNENFVSGSPEEKTRLRQPSSASSLFISVDLGVHSHDFLSLPR